MIINKILEAFIENDSLDAKKIAKLLNYKKTQRIEKILYGLLNNEVIIFNDNKYYLDKTKIQTAKLSYRRFEYYLNYSDNKLKIYQNNIYNAIMGDEVLFTFINYEAVVCKVINRNKNIFVGTILMRQNDYNYLPDSLFDIRKYKIINPKKLKLKHNYKVKAKISNINDSIIEFELIDVIGHLKDPKVDITAILIDNEIEEKFSSEIIRDLKKFPKDIEVKNHKNRVDLTNLLTMTIDGDDARDFDDAISISKYPDYYNLKVHIADVSYYVQYNDALDKEALNRSTSIYLCDRVIPMLPTRLSNELCSLVPNENRLTITCDMDVSLDGEIINYKFYESIINSDYRMTYDNVNKIINNDKKQIKKYHEIVDTIKDMLALSNIIRTKRFKDGAIDFERNEAKIILNKHGKAIDVCERVRHESEKLIEDFMILANHAVSKHLMYTSYPSLYRVHMEPKKLQLEEFISLMYEFNYKFKGQNITSKELQDCLDKFKDDDNYHIIKEMLLKSMQKATYDPSCLGHFGLGLKEYTHFTSPIRRYPDLIVHRMLRKYCINNQIDEYDNDQKLMIEYAKITSLKERDAIKIERLISDIKKAEYIETRKNEVFEAMIVSVKEFGFFVELANTIEGLVPKHNLNRLSEYENNKIVCYDIVTDEIIKEYHLGDKVLVKVNSTNLTNGKIEFKLIER